MNWRCWLWCLTSLVACTTEVKPTDSETHWLQVCEFDEDCPPTAQCICGICTQECTGACSLTQTHCVETTADRCGEMAQSPTGQMCATGCETSAQCDEGQRCASGVCVAQRTAEIRESNSAPTASAPPQSAAPASASGAGGATMLVGAGGYIATRNPVDTGGMTGNSQMIAAPSAEIDSGSALSNIPR